MFKLLKIKMLNSEYWSDRITYWIKEYNTKIAKWFFEKKMDLNK